MAYTFNGKVGILALIVIIILLILGKYTSVLISERSPIFIAGMISIIAGVFLFLVDIIFRQKNRLGYATLSFLGKLMEIVFVVLGLVFIFDPAKNLAKNFSPNYDLIAIGIYFVVLLIILLLFNVKSYGYRNYRNLRIH